MKNRILNKYPDSVFTTTRSQKVYFADFSKRTNKNRGVEVSETIPKDPNDENLDMDCFVIDNSNCHSFEYNVFDDLQFHDENGKQLPHGECCIFPTINDGRSWFVILEIKDTTEKVSNYKKNIEGKMDSMFKVFRNQVGITNTIYFIASFPPKTIHDQSIFNDYVDLKNYRKTVMVVSNSATIIDNHSLDPYN